MGSSAFALEGPPPLPPDVKSQMGPSNPMADVTGMVDKGGSPGAAPSSTGDLQQKADIVKRVLETMADGMGVGKTLISQAIEKIDQAIQLEAKSGPGAAVTGGSPTGGPTGTGQPPTGFPG